MPSRQGGSQVSHDVKTLFDYLLHSGDSVDRKTLWRFTEDETDLSQESSVWCSEMSFTHTKGLSLLHTPLYIDTGHTFSLCHFYHKWLSGLNTATTGLGGFFFSFNNESIVTMARSSSHPERSSLSAACSLSKRCRIWVQKVALEVFTSCTGHPRLRSDRSLPLHYFRKPDAVMKISGPCPSRWTQACLSKGSYQLTTENAEAYF